MGREGGAATRRRINTCIACNQACLDHVFENQRATCMVNPRACHETELVIANPPRAKKFAVVGAGPAGLACATTLAERGHAVTLFEQSAEIGGQFNMAKRIPGKEEFHESLRYFSHRIADTGVDLRLNTRAIARQLRGFDDVILATGITPAPITIPGSDRANVLSYVDVVLLGQAGRQARRDRRRGRHRLRRRRIPDAIRAVADDRYRALDARMGHRRRRRASRRARQTAPEPSDREVWLLQRTPGRRASASTRRPAGCTAHR